MIKRSVSLMLCSLLFSCFPASAAPADFDFGDTLYISKCKGIWEEPYVNSLILIPPGSTVDGIYYHRLYAVYVEAEGGYVVRSKTGSHRSFSKTVAPDAIGLCLNYSPGTKQGRDFARSNFLVWNKIRVGDVLKLSGADLASGEVSTSGTWGTDSFKSSATLSVTFKSEFKKKTGYSDKTIVAFGDSLTANGAWTEEVGDALGASIINSGVGGDRTNEGLVRFDEYVKKYSPDIVLLMYGVNDFVSFKDAGSLSEFASNLRKLCGLCTELGAKVILITPNDIKLDSSIVPAAALASVGGAEAGYEKYLNAVKKTAEAKGDGLIDLNAAFEGLKPDTFLCDSVHPNSRGYDIFVEEITAYLLRHEEALTGASETNAVSDTSQPAPEQVIDTDALTDPEGTYAEQGSDTPKADSSTAVKTVLIAAAVAVCAAAVALLVHIMKKKRK